MLSAIAIAITDAILTRGKKKERMRKRERERDRCLKRNFTRLFHDDLLHLSY